MLNISNSYFEPVRQLEKTLINLNLEVDNASKCRFSKLAFKLNGVNKSGKHEYINCVGNSCLLVLSTPEKSSQISLRIDENNIVRINAINLQESMNLSNTILIEC